MTRTTPSAPSAPPVLRPAFVRYLIALGSGALGDALVFVALPFLVLELSGDPAAVATTLLLASLSRFAGPFLGALADALPPRASLVAAGLLRGALFGLVGALAVADRLPVAGVWAAAFLSGAIAAFVVAAGNVAVPRLVPRAGLMRANSLVQGALMGLPLVGFGVGGVLVAGLGAAGTVLAAAPLVAGLGLLMTSVRIPPAAPDANEEAPRPGRSALRFLADVASGGRWLLTAGPLALVLPLSLILNASLAFLNARMPVVMQASGHGATGYGTFEALVSAGMAGGIGLVALLGNRVAPQHLASVAQASVAAGFATMALGGHPARLVGGATMGLGVGMAEVALITLFQIAVPDRLRGRTMGAIFAANAAGQALGAVVAGRLAAIPPEATFAAAAVAAAGAATAWAVGTRLGRARLAALVEGTA